MNHFDVTNFFIRKCKNTRVLNSGQTNQTLRIVASDKTVCQVQVLEVVNVSFGSEHDHDSEAYNIRITKNTYLSLRSLMLSTSV